MSSRGSLSRSAVLCLTAAAAVSVLGCGEPSSPNPPPLPAPTNLTVQQLPSGDIEVTWQDNSDDEQAFELGRSSAGPGGTFSLLASLGAGVSTYQDGEVTGVGEYCYRVRAMGPSGTAPSAYAPAACLQVAAPAAPSALAATATFGQVDLTWTDNATDETGYEIWKSTTGANGTFALEAPAPAGTTSYSNTSLLDGAEYCYRVRATGTGGRASSFSTTACATTPVPSLPPPAAPGGLAATPSSPAAIDLAWNDNSSDETGFEIWRSTTGATGTYSLLKSVAANVTSSGDAGLTASTEYCYEVRAIGGGSAPPSGFSATVCATTPAPPPPATPSGATAAATSTTAITLTWTDNSSNESGFEVWRSTAGASGVYTALTTVAANTTTANDAGLTAGNQYCYKVKALGGAGVPSSPLSGSDCATTPAPVATPTGVSASATSTTAIALTWTDNSSNETGFDVWRSTTGASGTYSLLKSVAANATGTTDTGLTPGNQYCYKVKALGGGIIPSSPLSGSDCATTPAPPAAPSGLSASATSSSAIALSWTDNSSTEAGFEVWRSTGGPSGTYTLLKTVAANATSTSNTGLDPSTQYCYEVRATGAGSIPDSPFTTPDCATTQALVSVRVVLFGDSNTDRCEEDWLAPVSPSRRSSYVSISPNLGPNDPHLSCSVAGKVQADWEGQRTNPITVVNHAIASTTTGGNTQMAGDLDRSSQGSPNARFSVGGTTRFEAEVLGVGKPWSGGEPMNSNFPGGAIIRVNAFTPGANDFVYVSMGTNDDAGPTRTLTAAQTETNLRWMAQKWIDAGRAPDHFIITTLAPRTGANSPTSIPDRNDRIRTLASDLGLHLIDLAGHVSDDNGATWSSATLHIGDGVHYTQTVRGWLSDRIVEWMSGETP